MDKNKCKKCDPCNKKIKCKRGNTGPTGPTGSDGSIGFTGPTGPSGVIECISNTGCADPSDSIIVQQQQITGFRDKFVSKNWVISFNISTGSVDFTEDILVINTPGSNSATIAGININVICDSSISFNIETVGENGLILIKKNNMTIQEITFPYSGQSNVISISKGDKFEINLISQSNNISAIISNFVVKYNCCNIRSIPIVNYISDKLEFSDSKAIGINGYSTDRFIGQGNTIDNIIGSEFTSFLNVAFIVCKRTIVNHACIAIKNIISLNPNSGIDINLYYSKPILGKYKNLTVIPLSLGYVVTNNSSNFISVDISKLELIEGDLVAIRTNPILGVRYLLSVTLTYDVRI